MSRDRVTIEKATKYFGKVRALEEASLKVVSGEVVLIIGPSGSGKSTLLRAVNRLETLTAGDIWIDDDHVTSQSSDIRKIREEVGMVFQNFNLFPHLSVMENLTLAPRDVKKISKADAEKRGLELLQTVGLEEKAEAWPDQLSGG